MTTCVRKINTRKCNFETLISSVNLYHAFLHLLPAIHLYSTSLPNLPAVISETTMRLHHTKHHNAYVTNLNASLEKLDAAMAKGDVSAIIALQGALRFNGGGHLNHTLFWENLTPPGSSSTSGPTGALKQAIEDCFCTVENLQKQFIPMTIGVQGSGWGWLGYNKTTHRLEIATCANQDPLQATTGLLPIFGIDVWEVRNSTFLFSIFEVFSLKSFIPPLFFFTSLIF